MPHKANKKDAEQSAFSPMSPEALRDWRKGLGMKQKDAAEALGLKKRVIQYYETGIRDGKKVEIPLCVRLACHAISVGIADFNGSETKLRPVTTPSPEEGDS